MASVFDRPQTGGGGPQSGQTEQQVITLINNRVNPIARTGNTQAWPANKLTAPTLNTTQVTEMAPNLYFTTDRALAAAEIPLDLGTVTGGTQYSQLRSVSHEGGNAINVPSGNEHGAADGGFLLELNGFMAQVLFSDLNDLAVKASNDTTADTSGNTQNAILFRSPDTDNGIDSIYAGLTSTGKLLLAGSHNDGSSTTDVTDDIKLYPSDHARHGTFNRDDPAETTLADDDYAVFFDTSESFSPPKRISIANLKTVLGSGGGGGGTLTATQLEALIDDTQGNVDASLNSDSSKIVLTATVSGGGGGSFTLTQANLRPVLDNTLLVGSGLTKTVSTANNTITLDTAGGTPGGNPANHERVYWGHQDSIPDGTWETTDAQDNQDVRTAGTTFTINITGVLNGDYYYMIFPNDRLPTRIVDGVGADRTNSFTTVALNDLIGTNDFTAYYRQNNGGQTLPFSLTITTA